MRRELKAKTDAIRRQHVLAAAIRVFAAKGFRGATIRDIAKEADVADGTVYNLFESKEALLLGIIEPLRQASLGSPPAPPADGALPAATDAAALLEGMIAARWAELTPDMLAMMRVVWAEALTDRALARLYVTQILDPVLQGTEPLFAALTAKGAIITGDLPLTSRLVVASFLGLALLRMLGDDLLEDRSADVPQLLARLLSDGMLPRHRPE